MSAEPTNRRSHPLRGWWPLIAVSVAAPLLLLVPNELRNAVPTWAWAWALIFAFFGAMKWLTWRRAPATQASPWLQLGYLVAWPGLDARTFLSSDAARSEPVDPRVGIVALGKLFLGAALFWGAARVVPDDWPLVRGWFGLAGLAIGVLGGLFHFMSWLWRASGVDAQPIMNAPLRSRNMADFWNRRWNIAFHDFAARFIHRPLSARYGPAAAIFAVFLFSGLLHDGVLSLSAGAGFGGPTLYFVIQLVGLGLERSRLLAPLAARHPLFERTYAVLVIVGPVGLLFHRPFIERVWLPFLQAVGAI
jgi:hypothetical protein